MKKYQIELFHWVGMKDDHLENVKEILESNPEFIHGENKFGENALHIACRVNNFQIAKWLIQNTDVNYNKVIDKGNALFVAIENNCFEIAEYLLNETNINYKVCNKQGKGIFHLLMQEGNDKLIDILIAKYPEGVNLLDNQMQNCLFDYILHYIKHEKTYIFDIIEQEMQPAIFNTLNTDGKNLLEFYIDYIDNSESEIEKQLKEDFFVHLKGQLEFYFAK